MNHVIKEIDYHVMEMTISRHSALNYNIKGKKIPVSIIEDKDLRNSQSNEKHPISWIFIVQLMGCSSKIGLLFFLAQFSKNRP